MKNKFFLVVFFPLAIINFLEVPLTATAQDIVPFDCPPEPEYITYWWCPWCKPKIDSTNLDTYNEIMDLYNGKSDEDAPKAITLWFGKRDGRVGVFDSNELKTVFQSASAGNTCVEQTFADTVCYTLHYSDIFNSKTLGTIQRLKTLDAFRNFVLGVATANPVKLALNAKTLMQNVVVPAMYKVIGGISYLARIDPGRRFQLQLKSQCKI